VWIFIRYRRAVCRSSLKASSAGRRCLRGEERALKETASVRQESLEGMTPCVVPPDEREIINTSYETSPARPMCCTVGGRTVLAMNRQTIKKLTSKLVRAMKSHNERVAEQWIQRLESPHQNGGLLRTPDQPLSSAMKTVVF
jgi:hypothetical protein